MNSSLTLTLHDAKAVSKNFQRKATERGKIDGGYKSKQSMKHEEFQQGKKNVVRTYI